MTVCRTRNSVILDVKPFGIVQAKFFVFAKYSCHSVIVVNYSFNYFSLWKWYVMQ